MQLRRFKRIYIEITNVCNLKCSFCPGSGREPGFISEENFKDTLNQIDGFTRFIYLHVKGEPLLHPQLGGLLDLCAEKNFSVNLATNGTLIGRCSETLLKSRAVRKVSFSLHSLEGLDDPADAARYIDDILSFAIEASKRKIIVELKLWNLDAGKSELNSFILERIKSGLNDGAVFPEDETSGKGIRLAERIFLSRAKQFAWPDVNSPEIGASGFCYGLKTQVAILVDGTVVPCCLDGKGIINLGNIRESQFSEILQSKRSADIVTGFSERRAVEELCRKCSYRSRFDLQQPV